MSISRKLSEADWKLDNIMDELSKELKARERAVAEGSKAESERSNKGRKLPGTTTTLFSGNQYCCFCGQSHLPDSCRKVTDPEARQKLLKEAGRCFLCLRKGHMSRNCTRRGARCSNCGGHHHKSICFKSERQSDESPSQDFHSQGEKSLNPKAEPFKSASLFVDHDSTVLLQTARAECFNVENAERHINLRMAFDSGSQRSYITEHACKQLDLKPVGKHELRIAAFGDNKGRVQSCKVVKIGIETRDRGVRELTLFTVPLICEPLNGTLSKRSVQAYPHLADLELADSTEDGEVINLDILIGLDYYWSFVTGEVIKGGTGPTAVYSSLGWILSGPVVGSASTLVMHILMAEAKSIQSKSSLDQQLRSFWELEALGIVEENESLYEQFKSNILFNGERYQVVLPWRDRARKLPDNYMLSLSRLNGLMRRLRKQPRLFEEYDNAIKEQLAKGIVEIVSEPHNASGEHVHYLPHHAVIRHDKETTKLRVVYDASAKSTGPSLNDCLYVGPKFNQRIMDILLRFRLHRCAFVADIEKAFLMIAVAEQDRDALRFLWVDDIRKGTPDIQVLRFTRVAFGVASSPFLLNATVKYHIEKFLETKPNVALKLINSVYVDDVVCGANDENEALSLFGEFKSLLSGGGFNLRKFVCNGDVSGDSSASSRSGEHRVLGILWDIGRDEFVLDLSEVVKNVKEENVTKREIISIGSRIFDPLGIVSPVTIKVKLLFQELHRAKIGWDDVITGDLLQQWSSILSVLRESESVCVPRWCFKNCEKTKLRLCGFSDASTRAYAAVVYIQCGSGSERRMVFLTSKSRVAPLGGVTVPRLELLGALLLSRLISSVYEALKGELELQSSVCYTDSQVTLFWILGENKEWKPFVESRVREIRKLVPGDHWRFCPGKDNPADIPTRGMTIKELKETSLWFNGPDWVRQEDTEDLDTEEALREVPDGCMLELKELERRTHNLLVNESSLSAVFEIRNYSTLDRLCRITGFVLKFVELLKSCRGARTRKRGGRAETQSLHDHGARSTVNECEALIPSRQDAYTALLLRAEQLWIIDCQRDLVNQTNFGDLRKQLQLFQDQQGVWRCGGRLKNAELPYDAKHLYCCRLDTILQSW